MKNRLKDLSDAGVSIWLDDLSRERLDTGNLARLRDEKSVVGVTTNPTIFAAALAKGTPTMAIRELAATGATVDEAIRALTTDDVRHACDVFAGIHAATNGVDGRVSIEVSPGLAKDTDGTIAEAADLWKTVDRPNTLIKIPATEAGLPAITATLAEGISVNVTLIFAGPLRPRHRRLPRGAGTGHENGHDLSGIHSVAWLLRVPRGRRGRQATRRDRDGGSGSIEGRPPSPTPAWPTRRTSGGSTPIARKPWPRRARTSSGRSGPRPVSKIRACRTPSTSPELVVADTVDTMPREAPERLRRGRRGRRRHRGRHRERSPAA